MLELSHYLVELQTETATFITVNSEYAKAVTKFELAKHTIRQALYDEKQAGSKITEEAIRTASIVQTAALYECVQTMLCALENTKMRIETLKMIIQAQSK